MKYFITVLLISFNLPLLIAQLRPTVEGAIHYFERLEEANFNDSERKDIKYYTQNFVYYNLPLSAGNESKVRQFVDLLIGKEDLHKAYSEEFIAFFYKYHDRFNESEIRRISLILDSLIEDDKAVAYSFIIGLYELKKFIPALRASLSKNVFKEMERSIIASGGVENFRDLYLITSLANLDLTIQDSLLNLIKNAYDLTLSQNKENYDQINRRKSQLYRIMIPKTLRYLNNYKEVISRTLYLLNEKKVFPSHGDQSGIDCAYDYYRDLILPHLFRSHKAMNYWGNFHGDKPKYFDDEFFETHRTPELMRAALIEFDILEK